MIHKLNLGIANAYLLEGDQPILVDTGGPNSYGALQKAVEAFGSRLEDLKLILHTHGHGDHVGSTAQLHARFGIPSAVHRGDWKMVESGHNLPFGYTRWSARLIAPFVNTPFEAFKPDHALDETFDLSTYGIRGQILHTPGHTAGSISILLESGDAIVGDVLMGGHMGGTFLASRVRTHYFVDDIGQVYASVNSLLNIGVERFFVGHGGPLSRKGVQQWLMRAYEGKRQEGFVLQ